MVLFRLGRKILSAGCAGCAAVVIVMNVVVVAIVVTMDAVVMDAVVMDAVIVMIKPSTLNLKNPAKQEFTSFVRSTKLDNLSKHDAQI